MQAIIMAGGKGSRLRPLTNNTPKPLVKIIDKPVMEYVIENLAEAGVKDIAVTVGYKADMIMDYFGDGSKWGVRLEYFVEDTPLGTAGGVKNVESYIYEEFLVMSADGLSNIDLKEFLTFHKSHDGIASMAVKHIDDARGFGLVEVDSEDRIVSFVEKPQNICSGLINTGIYLFEPNIFEYIPKGVSDFSYDIFPGLLGSIYAYKTESYWSDIGTLFDYYLTNQYVCMHPDSFGLNF